LNHMVGLGKKLASLDHLGTHENTFCLGENCCGARSCCWPANPVSCPLLLMC
jgi:hypothetical protein